LMSVRCSFRRSPSLRNLLIMFAGIWPALFWSIWCLDANSSCRSAPASEALTAPRRQRRRLDLAGGGRDDATHHVVSHVHLAPSSCAAANQDLLVRSEWRGGDLRVAHHHGAVRAAASAALLPSNQPFGAGTRRSGRRWSLVWRCPAGASDDPSRSFDSPERLGPLLWNAIGRDALDVTRLQGGQRGRARRQVHDWDRKKLLRGLIWTPHQAARWRGIRSKWKTPCLTKSEL
jgi:hypothetical protein